MYIFNNEKLFWIMILMYCNEMYVLGGGGGDFLGNWYDFVFR